MNFHEVTGRASVIRQGTADRAKIVSPPLHNFPDFLNA